MSRRLKPMIPRHAVAGMLFLLLASGMAGATAPSPFSVSVGLAPERLTVGSEATLWATIAIPEGHYLYADRTRLTPEPVPGLRYGPERRPPGTPHADPFSGTVGVYTGAVRIQVPVTVAPDAATGPLRLPLRVAFQGCTEKMCFIPESHALVVETAIEPDTEAGPEPGAGVEPGRGTGSDPDPAPPQEKFIFGPPSSGPDARPIGPDTPPIGLDDSPIEPDVRPSLEVPEDPKAEAVPSDPSTAEPGMAGTARPRPEAAFPEVPVPEVPVPEVPVPEVPVPEVPVPEVPVPDTPGPPLGQISARFGLIGLLAAAFLWGLLASLTPCVYPMIPVTIGVVGAAGGASAWRGFGLSAIYVLGMSLTYAGMGVAAARTGALFGALAAHPATRTAVALIFVLLALGMFDIIAVQMPSSLASRLAGLRAAGLAGIFLTGALSGAVVGPCVGPMLVALLIYIAGLGSGAMGFLIMWSFALGLGVIFLVAGTFSGALAALPRSGVWMERLKRIFGALLLAGALYYIAPVLPPAALDLALGLFLTGAGIFAGGLDPLDAAAGPWRRIFKTVGIALLTLGVVLVARLAIDMPPGGGATVGGGNGPAPTGAIHWLTDEPTALALARREGRPVMIDFRADWCAACRRMEKRTFPDPRVVEAAKDFVNLKIDAEDPSEPKMRALLAKYGVVGLPTLIFLTADGRMVPGGPVTEFIGPAELAARLRAISKKSFAFSDGGA